MTRTRSSRITAVLAATTLALVASCGSDDENESEQNDAPAADETDDAPADDAADDDSGDEGDADSEAITMADVEANADTDSCWAVIDGTVYDLTDWIDEHPGGPARIQNLCGTDATEDFGDQHGGAGAPADALANFEIGELAE